MLSSVLSAAWLFVALPDCLPDALPDALPTPALVRATAGPTPNEGKNDAHEETVTPQSVGVDSAAGIDQRALARYGWKLCQGSCQMVCAVHGGGLKWMLLNPGEKPSQGEASASAKPPQRRTHTEIRRAGLFGRQRVAVEVEEPDFGTGVEDGKPPHPPGDIGGRPLQGPVQFRTTGTAGPPNVTGSSPACPTCDVIHSGGT